MNKIKKYFERVDLRKLAGINRILGVDVTDEHVRIVEMQKKGPVYNRFKASFRVVKTLSLDFDSVLSVRQNAGKIKKVLEEHQVASRFAVSAIQSLGVKTVSTKIPANVHNIREWIEENQERLLRLPVPINEIEHAYEILESTESETAVEVSFLRKSEIEEHKRLFNEAGLTLVALGVGDRDGSMNHADALGISAEYNLAAGLAIKGFLPEASSLNLIDSEAKTRLEETIYKNLAKRVVIAFGSVLIALLTLQALANWIVHHQLQSIDDQLTGSSLAEVSVLEKQVARLEKEEAAFKANAYKARYAKAMHDLAEAAPADVWFFKVSFEEPTPNASRITVSGYSRSVEHITDFLRNIRKYCSDIELIRTGSPTPSENLVPVRSKVDEFVSFTVKASIQ